MGLSSTKAGIKQNTDAYWNHWFKRDLQRKIWNYHLENIHFTLDDLLHYAREELEFTGGRTTLYKILKSVGYKYKLVNQQKILSEQKRLISDKIKFFLRV